jgi:formylglycine-generating enzyme
MIRIILVAAAALIYSRPASADVFGTGANSFEIEFVTVGAPNNPEDLTGFPNPAGKVEYEYRIGKFEVSIDMVKKASAQGGSGISVYDWGYSPNLPAVVNTWFDAARFVNWLNASKGYPPAYKFDSSRDFQLRQPSDPGYDPNNRYRNRLAYYFLPSMDEWYKAAITTPSPAFTTTIPQAAIAVPTGWIMAAIRSSTPSFSTVELLESRMRLPM